jgi:hypothetical protein
MDALQHEYLGLVSELHIREQMLTESPDLESHIARLKRQIAVKAMVLNSKRIEIPLHSLKWEWNEKELRRAVAKAAKSLLKNEPKVEIPVMGEKVPKRKLPKITPRKVRIKND